MNERALAFLHELEKADEAVAAVLTELDELSTETERLRVRSLELEAFMIRLPAERDRIGAGLADARLIVEGGRVALTAAEAELDAAERAGDANREAAARRAAVRARDALRSAERKVAAIEEESNQLEAESREAEREAAALAVGAGRLAAALRARPGLAEHAGTEPRPGLAGIAEWASGARATLFVARARLASEREAVIRQANELGALVLGEPLTASSAALVARRVEGREP